MIVQEHARMVVDAIPMSLVATHTVIPQNNEQEKANQ